MMTACPVPLKSIAALVVALHLVLLAWILWFAPVPTLPIKPKKFSVQTVQLTPKSSQVIKKQPELIAQAKVTVKEPVKKAVIEPVKEPVQKNEPKAVPKAEPKAAPKAIPKPIAKAAPKEKVKPAAKKPAPKEISKPVAKAAPQQKATPAKSALDAVKQKLAAIPTFIPTTNSAGDVSDAPFDYEEGLVSRLRILLKLPEMGDVRVALTLNRQGKVIKTEILSAANQVNKRAIETQLPAIQFPPFGQAFPGENTHTFTITLTNL